MFFCWFFVVDGTDHLESHYFNAINISKILFFSSMSFLGLLLALQFFALSVFCVGEVGGGCQPLGWTEEGV